MKYFLLFIAVFNAAFLFGQQDLNEAEILIDNNRCSEAIELLEKLQSDYSALYGNIDTSHYSKSLVHLAKAYVCINNWDKALPLFLQAKSVYESQDALMNTYFSDILAYLGRYYENIGNVENAELMYKQTLLVREKVFGTQHPKYVEIVLSLGNFYRATGNYEYSRNYLENAMAIELEQHGEFSAQYSIVLQALGSLYLAMGNNEKANYLLNKALPIIENTYGRESDQYMGALNDLGVVYFNLSQFENAEQVFSEIIDLMIKTGNANNVFIATYYQNLASVYIMMGNYSKAEPMLAKAMDISAAQYGSKSLAYAYILYTLGALYREQREYDKSEEVLLNVLKIVKKISGTKSIFYAQVLNALGTVAYDKGRSPKYADSSKASFKRSISYYSESNNILKQLVGNGNIQYINNLSGMAITYQQLGETEKTKTMLLEAVDILKTHAPEYEQTLFNLLNNLAGVYFSLFEDDKAESLLKQTYVMFVNELQKNFAFLSESEKLAYVDMVRYQLDVYRSFYLERYKNNQTIAADFYNLELSSKGMILNTAIEVRKRIVNTSKNDVLYEYDKWIMLNSMLAKQYSLPENQRSFNVDSLENEANISEKKWMQNCDCFSGINQTTWQDVKNNLADEEVAVEFAAFQVMNRNNWTDSVMYVAIVTRKSFNFPKIVPLCEESHLKKIMLVEGSTDPNYISRMYRGVVYPGQGKTINYGVELYENIWEPLELYLMNCSKVYYAPSGMLHQLSFAAIPLNDSVCISDKYNLIRVSSTAQIIDSKQQEMPNPESIMVYGGIVFDTELAEQVVLARQFSKTKVDVYDEMYDASQESSRGESWSYLPGTLTEAQGIHFLAKKSELQSTMRSGKDAIEELFKHDVENLAPDVIHIATHGFFFPNTGIDEMHGFLFRNKKQLLYRSTKNPLNRAGLLFSGANNAWTGKELPDDIDDGILTAYEIANMQLHNTQLVVLSACETGLGDINNEEGVFGLQRAFKTAGVQYIIMSLWKVPDIETSEFMQLFYNKWFSGYSIEDAFNSAQAEMRNKYRGQPHKWAAFVLMN